MATPAQNIAALETALAAGELRVEIDGDLVVYKSNDQILKAIGYFTAQLTGVSAANPAPSATLAVFGEG